nr:methylmalonyl-CoA epimerase [Bacillus coahuilensis]
MFVKAVDHIGIAVKSIESSLSLYRDIFGLRLLKTERVESEGVIVAFLDAGNLKLELLEPFSEKSAIYSFIEKKGEGIHHIAFSVQGIEDRIEELKRNGIRMIHDKPKRGAAGAEVAFLHPSSTGRVLYEICEKSKGE